MGAWHSLRALAVAIVGIACGGGSSAPDAGGGADAGSDAGVCLSPSDFAIETPQSCAAAPVLGDWDRRIVDLATAPSSELLCREAIAPAATWFSIDVPAGERLAVQPFSYRDRVYLHLADACSEPSTCVERLRPADAASSSKGLVWENTGAEAASMVLEVSSSESTCRPYELEVRVGPTPANAACDAAIDLTGGAQPVADGRLAPPAVEGLGCMPDEFPLFYRVTVPDGENVAVSGAHGLARDCSGTTCVGQSAGDYVQYRNRTGAAEDLIVVASGFGSRLVSASVSPPFANSVCEGAVPYGPGMDFYAPAFGAEDVATLPCVNFAVTDALYYSVEVPAQQSLVVADAPRGTAIFESCDATACEGVTGLQRYAVHRNETDAAIEVIVRVAHRESTLERPQQIELQLASTAPSTCASAEPLAIGSPALNFHQLEGASTGTEVCGYSVHSRAFFQVEVPEGYWLRASAWGAGGSSSSTLVVMALDECGASACSSSVGSELHYPGFDVPATETQTVTLAIGDTRSSTELSVIGLALELAGTP